MDYPAVVTGLMSGDLGFFFDKCKLNPGIVLKNLVGGCQSYNTPAYNNNIVFHLAFLPEN